METRNRFKDFVVKQNYITELSAVEHVILWVNVGLSVAFFVVQMILSQEAKPYTQWTTWLTLIATILSIFSVMAGAKQRILCPLMGVISSCFLIAVAWGNHLPGSMVMYGYNIIMQTVVFIIWLKSSKNKVTIQPEKLKLWAVIVYILAFFALTALLAWVEGIENFSKFWFNDKPLPATIRIFDAMVLAFTLAALVPMIKKYDFVWWVYIICDIAIAATWASKAILIDDQNTFNSWSMFASGISMTATCVVGIINWKKSAKNKA